MSIEKMNKKSSVMAHTALHCVYYFHYFSRRFNVVCRKSIPVLVCMLNQCAIVQLLVYSYVYRIYGVKNSLQVSSLLCQKF